MRRNRQWLKIIEGHRYFMKIAFHLNCLEHGGAERVVSNLANQFAREGHEVFVTTQWFGEKEFELDKNVHRVHVGLREEDNRRGRVHKYVSRVKYLKDFIKSEKPDVLVAFAQKAIYRSLMASIGTKCPVCVCVRTNPVGNYDSFLDKIQIKWLFPKAAGFVFQTNDQRDFFGKYASGKSTVILNPIHQKYIDEPDVASREKVVVQTGRLDHFKNQPMLVDAFAIVHQTHPEYVLKIIGPDSKDGTKEILEEKINKYNAQDYIKLVGGSDCLEKDIKNASAFAFSSNCEGMPNALLEAMALRLPIVSTDCPCGGPATIIENHKNGILVPVDDKEEMAKAICYMLDNPNEAERMGKEAGNIAKLANADAVYRQWKEYLENIIKK